MTQTAKRADFPFLFLRNQGNLRMEFDRFPLKTVEPGLLFPCMADGSACPPCVMNVPA